MEPITGSIERSDGPSFWVKVKEAFRQAGQAVDWHEAERDLRAYEQQFTETVVNDYAAWKTGRPRQWTPETLDGWDYDHNYTGKKPQARLLYVNAAGTLSNPKHRNRIAGHIAIESDGKVFNYTPQGLSIVSARDYIHNITHRQQGDGPQAVYAYPLGLTAEERRQLAHELNLYYGKPYDIKHRNCAHCTVDSLKKITANSPFPVPKTIQIFDPIITQLSPYNLYSPTDVINDVKSSQRIYGPTFIYQPPKQQRTWDSDVWGGF